MMHFATIKTVLKPFWRKNHVLIALLGVFLAILAATPAAVYFEQKSSLPLLFKLRGERTPPNNIWIVSLNSAAHQRLGLPSLSNLWPREILAATINSLAHAGAKLIVMDLAFKEPRDEQGDAALEEAISNAGNVVLFTYLKRQQMVLNGGLADIEEVHPPHERFLNAALGTGFFTLPKDRLIQRTDLSPHISGACSQPLFIAQHLQQNTVDITMLSQGFYINFYGPALTLNTLAIDKLLNSAPTALPQFKDAVVYIGYLETAQTEQIDTYATVFSNRHGVDLSGVEISATVTANLLDGSGLRPLSPLFRAIVAAGLFFVIFILGRRWPKLYLPASGAAIAGAFALSYTQFLQFTWWPLSTMCLTTAAACALLFLQFHSKQKQHLRFVQRALQQHMPDHAAQKLSRNLVQLENEHSLVFGVCLVTDIKGYTALAERLEPNELHQLMNRYYAVLVAAVEQHQGFVGNIVGDSLVAMWTGPAVTPQMCESAYNAVATINHKLQQQADLNDQLPTCMALHAGQFSLGHLGAQGHFEYSPVGDMINTATRVEHFNRTLHTHFLCSEPVAKQLFKLNNPPPLIHLGAFTMRNRKHATELFSNCEDAATASQFTQALQRFNNDNIDEAKNLFEALANTKNHGPSQYYLALLQQPASDNLSSL